MPSRVFEAEQVAYGCAPFTKVQVVFNQAADCLNLVVPGSRRGALQLLAGGPWTTAVEGRTCRVNDIVVIDFSSEEKALDFSRCLAAAEQESEKTAPPKSASGEDEQLEAHSSKRPRVEDDAALDLDSLCQAVP